MLVEREQLAIKGFNGGVIFLALVSFVLCASVVGCQQVPKHGAILSSSEDALFRASAKGDLTEVKGLLDQGTNVNAREEEDETPLMYAAVEGRTEVVGLLLDRGASLNAVSVNNETALVRAVGMNRYETVALLLNRGADIEKGNPLIYAAGAGDVKMIRLLLNRGANINAPNNEGDTALAAAVSRRVSAETIRLLLSAGADVNIKNKRGETPLMRAERSGDESLVSLLTKAS